MHDIAAPFHCEPDVCLSNRWQTLLDTGISQWYVCVHMHVCIWYSVSMFVYLGGELFALLEKEGIFLEDPAR